MPSIWTFSRPHHRDITGTNGHYGDGRSQLRHNHEPYKKTLFDRHFLEKSRLLPNCHDFRDFYDFSVIYQDFTFIFFSFLITYT